ncbi:hypothetical protein VNO78_31901 [Psophocarpus tetragonolobus]|uniref:NAC domain-containing protein n=1 Tax=Psophocarpus tetragonolobus TaxID=3891 RepID=A0AAN9RZI0_PSOTE
MFQVMHRLIMDVAKLHDSEDNDKDKKEAEVVLPGFRFHPTDEELVGFYLRRKVEKKPLRIELIKQIDIYKYDPWDLPRRKYRNSIRPNRVTGSGFWKATGIDKPIYCVKEPHECIGLKKSLVYYCGSAGKGTKTDWMMHEFRLPPNGKTSNNPQANDVNVQEAEVWTLCRIFKRVPSYKRYTPNLKDSAAITKPINSSSSKTCSQESDKAKTFTNIQQNETKPHVDQLVHAQQTPTSFWNHHNNDNWDDLTSVVHFAIHPSTLSHHSSFSTS